MVEHQSFSSPFTVQTLDQIPTPILKLLVGLGPFLKQVSWCVDIVLWRAAQPRMSVLAVLFWIIGCLWTWQVIGFGLPSLILYKLAKDWLQVRTSRARREKLEKARQELRQKRLEELRRNGDEDDEDDERARKMQLQQQDEEDELIMRKIRPDGQVSLDDTIQHVANINQFIDYVGSATKNLFMYVDGTQPELTVSLLSVCLYLFPIWIVVSWLLGASGVFCIVGTLALISPSPWFKIIVSTLRHNLILTHLLTAIWAYGVAVMSYSLSCFKHQQQEVKRQTIKSRFYAIIGRAKVEKQKAMDALKADAEEEEQENKGTRSEMIFQFEVYENQVNNNKKKKKESCFILICTCSVGGLASTGLQT